MGTDAEPTATAASGVPDVERQTHLSHLTLMGMPGEGPRYDALDKRIDVPDGTDDGPTRCAVAGITPDSARSVRRD